MNKSASDKLDDDFKKIGEFGPYQMLVFVLLGFTASIPAFLAYGYIFIGATPDFRCSIPEWENETYEISNATYQQNLIDKYLIKTNDNDYDKCKFRYMRTDDNGHEFDNGSNTTSFIKKCDSWTFSTQYYGKTIVTDWHLFCEQSVKKSTFSTLYFIGTYGVLFSGIISDNIGRKSCTYMFIIANAIVSILMALLTNIQFSLNVKQILYGILRFLSGIVSNTYSAAFVLAIELTGPSYRIIAANSMYYFYILGEYITVFMCYFIRDYNQLYLCAAAFMCIFPVYFWMIPESPRWLMTQGKYKEASAVLKRIADSNKKQLPDEYNFCLLPDKDLNENETDELTSTEQNEMRLGFFEALKKIKRSRKLFLITLSIAFNWLTNNFVYYGITLGTGQLVGNPYLNFIYMTTTELFAIILSQFVFTKLGRKMPYILSMSFSGISLLLVYFIPKSLSFLITILALVGKFTISFTYNGIYIVTSELYPTIIRTTAVAFCQCVGRLGGVIAPQINLLGELFWQPLPFILYGTCAIISALLTLALVPETKNKNLSDTLEI